MTVIRKQDAPAPLDISRLNVGPPLANDIETVHKHSQNGALVSLETQVPKKHRDDVKPAPPKAPRRAIAPPNRRNAGPNVRYLSPREMLEYSQNLYAAGIIGFEDYEAMAFQPDLHPHFNKTIGALTGQVAAPDRPRDFIRHWQDRLNYVQRYYAADAREVRQANRILKALMAFPQHDNSLFN